MRVYGRTYDPLTKAPTWVVVETQLDGSNDLVYVTALAQCIKLNLNESPFWADWGIPAQTSVVQQIFPDFWMALMQQRYAPHFASLTLNKVPSTTPTYTMSIVTNQGTRLSQNVQAPT